MKKIGRTMGPRTPRAHPETRGRSRPCEARIGGASVLPALFRGTEPMRGPVWPDVRLTPPVLRPPCVRPLVRPPSKAVNGASLTKQEGLQQSVEPNQDLVERNAKWVQRKSVHIRSNRPKVGRNQPNSHSAFCTIELQPFVPSRGRGETPRPSRRKAQGPT